MFLFAVHAFAREASVMSKTLQGRTTLVEEQRAAFSALVSKYCRMAQMTDPLNENEPAAVDLSCDEVWGQFVLSHSHAHEFIYDLAVWAVPTFSELDSAEVQRLVVSVMKLIVHGASKVYQVVTSTNTKGEETSPVLPLHILRVVMHTFKEVLFAHTPRLPKHQSDTKSHKVAQDYCFKACGSRRRRTQDRAGEQRKSHAPVQRAVGIDAWALHLFADLVEIWRLCFRILQLCRAISPSLAENETCTA